MHQKCWLTLMIAMILSQGQIWKIPQWKNFFEKFKQFHSKIHNKNVICEFQPFSPWIKDLICHIKRLETYITSVNVGHWGSNILVMNAVHHSCHNGSTGVMTINPLHTGMFLNNHAIFCIWHHSWKMYKDEFSIFVFMKDKNMLA